MTAPKRFEIYNVGIAKTGTTSVGLMFKRYRSAHEFMFRESVEHIVARWEGSISAVGFRDFVLYRAEQGGLEMDSASFNHHYLDILLDEFPQAKFIFTARDCYSWLNSILNMSASFGTSTPGWMVNYGRTFGIEPRSDELAAVGDAVRKRPDRVEPLLKYWAESNGRILALLPPGRTLIVKTREISSSLDRIANFAGIDPSTLIRAVSHSNRGAAEIDFLQLMDRGPLESMVSAHCGQTMARLFPETAGTGA